jgi:hypothetical protein
MSRVPPWIALAAAIPLIVWVARRSQPAEADGPFAAASPCPSRGGGCAVGGVCGCQTRPPPLKPHPSAAGRPAETVEQPDPIWANAACYVCHTLFVQEELSKVHVQEKVPCIECHGLSAAHANDENVGATPPDVVFRRAEIDPMCLKCHETHDAPAREVVARFLQRRLSPKSTPACTDCHGRHKIEQPADK